MEDYPGLHEGFRGRRHCFQTCATLSHRAFRRAVICEVHTKWAAKLVLTVPGIKVREAGTVQVAQSRSGCTRKIEDLFSTYSEVDCASLNLRNSSYKISYCLPKATRSFNRASYCSPR